MAEVSRLEFAELCGISMDSLRKQISRKKVIAHGDGGKLIDTTNPLNKLFKDKQKQFAAQKQEMANLLGSIPAAPGKAPTVGESFGSVVPDRAGGKGGARVTKAQLRQRMVGTGDEDDDAMPEGVDDATFKAVAEAVKAGKSSEDVINGPQGWLLMKLKGDAELVTIRVQKEQLLLDKHAGRLVPVDMAADVLRSQAKTIFVNFENSIENIANIFCQIMAGGDIAMLTRITEEARRELKLAINRAGSDANAELDNIVNNYSDTKGNKL